MPNRTAVDSQRYTLRVAGHTYAGFTAVDTADHKRRTGRITPSGSKGDIVTFGNATEGGEWTLTKQYNATEYARLKAVSNPEAQLIGEVVDSAERRVGTGDKYTGGFTGVTKAGLRTDSAEALTMVITFDADGEVG